MKLVGWSDRSDCLDDSSPRSTVTDPATATPTSFDTQGASISAGAIAGAVIGGCAFLGLIVVLSICLLRKDRKSRRHSDEKSLRPGMVFVNNNNGNRNTSRVSRMRSTFIPITRRRTQHISANLLPSRPPLSDSSSPTASMPRTSEYEPNPFILPSTGSVATMGHSDIGSPMYYNNNTSRPMSRPRPSTRSSNSDELAYPFILHTSSRSTDLNRRPSRPLTSASGTTSRKASMLGATVSSGYPRLVLHTDAEDVPDAVDGPDAVVELPPQYADRRLTMPPPPHLEPRNPSYHRNPRPSPPPPPPPPATP
jgi:hypothetical protein